MKRAQIFTPGATLVAVSLVIGILIAVVNPPFQGPDEPGHFCRAWQIGEGRFFTKPGDATRDFLPSGVDELNRWSMARVPFHPSEKFTWRSIAAEWATPLHPEQRTFIFFPGASMYTPVPYLAQGAAAAIGRMATLPPIAILVLVRLANLLASTLVLLLAIRFTPAGKWSFTTLAMTPMALYLRSTASGDGMTIALAFLVTAVVLHLVRKEGEASRLEILTLLGASCALALCKPGYFLVPLLVLVTARRSGRHALLAIATAALTLAGLAFSASYARLNYWPMRADVVVNPPAQLQNVLTHPLHAVSLFLREWLTHAPRFAEQFIGNFGWLDAPLPKIVIVAWALLIAFVLVKEHGSVPLTERLTALLIVSGTLLLITLAQYLVWSQLGGNSIDGMQGRYFLPIAPMAAVVIGLGKREMTARTEQAIGLSIVAAGVVTVVTIVLRYFGA